MIVGYVEPSGESPALARAELLGALEAVDGVPGTGGLAELLEVRVPSEEALVRLAGRLALARRTLVAVGTSGDPEGAARAEGRRGRPAAFRRLGRPGAGADAAVLATGRAYLLGGGSVDLDRPAVRYWLASSGARPELLLREVAAVDRRAFAQRAMPRLPFRRPVSLPPRLARAAANLAAVRPGDRVLDPFVGTGALLAESALLGARVYGIDADPTMVRGALRNLEHLGVRAEELVAGDARDAELPGGERTFDALVTDPPYGRSSASLGDAPARLVPEVLARWQGALRPGGRVVVLSPGGPPLLDPPWTEDCRVAVRVHRSLTREFRRYRRAA